MLGNPLSNDFEKEKKKRTRKRVAAEIDSTGLPYL